MSIVNDAIMAAVDDADNSSSEASSSMGRSDAVASLSSDDVH